MPQIARRHAMPAAFALAMRPHSTPIHVRVFRWRSMQFTTMPACGLGCRRHTVLHYGDDDGKRHMRGPQCGPCSCTRRAKAGGHKTLYRVAGIAVPYIVCCEAVHKYACMCLALASGAITQRCCATPHHTVCCVLRKYMSMTVVVSICPSG